MSDLTLGYPILLHLRDKPVAVVGGGRVATRKVRYLLRAGAHVLVISPAVTSTLQSLAADGQVEWLDSVYQRDMFNDHMPVIVIAATDDERVNQTVAQDAHRIRALCNVANGSIDHSDFSNMAQIDQPPLTIALSTNGKSPALLRLLKARLADEIGEEYAVLAKWLGSIREAQQLRMPAQAERQQLYEQILLSDVLSLLREGKMEEAQRVFDQILLEVSPQ